MEYKYLLFDADNTILDFDKAESSAFKTTCENVGVKFSIDLYNKYNVINAKQWQLLEKGVLTREKLRIQRYYLLLNDMDLSIKMADEYDKQLGLQYFVFDGGLELLSRLKQKYKVYIVTNGTIEIQRPRLKYSGIENVVDGIFLSEEIGYSKPNKQYFDAVVEKIGDKNISNYFLIGDSLTADIGGATEYGIDSCWLNLHAAKAGEYKPKHIVNSFNELVDFFSKW